MTAPTQYNVPSTGNNANNGLAQQIQTVARVIGARNAIGAKRQIFFVSMGGFDTHDGQNVNQADLLARISHAIGYFDTVMSNIGGVDMRNNVTLFTASDFGRTITSNGDGTDHGWGAHHFVAGGAVNGGEIYGRFPQFQLNAGMDAANNAYLPVTSVDTDRRDARQVVRRQRHQPQHDLPEPEQLPSRPRFPETGLTIRSPDRHRRAACGLPFSCGRPRVAGAARCHGSMRLQDASVLDRLGEMVGARSRRWRRGRRWCGRPAARDESSAPTSRAASSPPAGSATRRRRGGSAGRAHRRRAARCSCPGGRSAIARAAATRSRTTLLASPSGAAASCSAATAGTSTCRSMRSSSGPLMRAW